jgi:hypothetical protein
MKKLFPFLFLVVLILAGCGGESKKKEEAKKETTSQETKSGKIVARVNGRPIYEGDLRGASLQEAIDEEILYQEGLKRGLDKQFEKAVEDYKKRLIVSALKKDIMGNLPKESEAAVTDKEVEDYYKENQSKYRILRLKEIVVEDKGLAEEIHKRALAGEDLEKIASDYSKSGKSVVVRDSRWNRRYNDLFSGKAVGAISDVIQEGNKFKILKLVETKDIPLNKVKQFIKYNILAKRRADAMHEFAEKIKKENNIKVEILEESK